MSQPRGGAGEYDIARKQSKIKGDITDQVSYFKKHQTGIAVLHKHIIETAPD
jgi:hypothetical protein